MTTTAATNGRVSDADALDALAVALEQTDGIDLAALREWAAEASRQTTRALSAAERDRACREARTRAERTLRERFPGVARDALAAALHRALVAGSDLASRAVDLGAVMREGVPPVEYLPGLGRGIAYAVGVTGFTGHPESGKTTTVARLALDAIRADRHVIWLDHEQGAGETVRRFAALGAEPDELSEGMTYLPFPGPPDWDDLGRLWDAHPGAVGVFDSTRGILRALGLDEDRAAEVGRFMDPLVEFALSREIACLLIDHVAKAATDATGYARGSGDKLAAVQAQWFVKRVRAFSETEPGEIELRRWKARSGGLPRSHRFAVGDGEGRLTFRRLDPDDSPEGRMEAAIIDWLRKRHPESASLSEIERAVTGSAERVRERVKALAADDARPVGTIPGDGRGVRYAYDATRDHEPQRPADF